MYQTGCKAYRQSAGNTLEDNRVVLIKLYDGVLRFLSQARKGILRGSPKIRGENISKALAIIEELHCAVDLGKGGLIASQLDNLYQYVTNQLTTASIKNDLHSLDEAHKVLITLKEGFETALHNQKSASSMAIPADGSARAAEGVRFAI